jgi:hypothetical protein
MKERSMPAIIIAPRLTVAVSILFTVILIGGILFLEEREVVAQERRQSENVTGRTNPLKGPADGFIGDGFEDYLHWKEGSVHGIWFVNFNGLGSVGIENDPSLPLESQTVLFQRPKPSTATTETHACLVTSTASMSDFNWFAKVKTLQQLRNTSPNGWETAWLVWHFTDNGHFYYFTLKTNGWELGKRDPAFPGGQKFLRTGATPKVTLGSFDGFNVQQNGATMTVSINGSKVITFTDGERPYLSGKIGLYNEDAFVYFDDISITYK